MKVILYFLLIVNFINFSYSQTDANGTGEEDATMMTITLHADYAKVMGVFPGVTKLEA